MTASILNILLKGAGEMTTSILHIPRGWADGLFHSHYSSLRERGGGHLHSSLYFSSFGRWADSRAPLLLQGKRNREIGLRKKKRGRDGHLQSRYFSLRGCGDDRLHS